MRLLVLLALCSVTCNSDGDTRRGDPAPRAVQRAGLELSATTKDAVIDAVLTNVGERPITVITGIPASLRTDFDAFTVHLAGRAFGFMGPRNASGSGLVELAPGESLHHLLDLADWATVRVSAGGDLINPGGLLGPGRYKARVVYRTEPGQASWVGELVLDGVEMTIR